jgi:ComF family protein
MVCDLLALLVPPVCAACSIPLRRAGDVVCGGCRRALPWLRGPQCVRCALPLTARHACPAARQAFDAAWAAVGYTGVARDLVAALKFRRGRPLADVMAAHLAVGVPGSLLAGATIVPVPAHPAHVRARGYDQARLLAAALARRTGVPPARALRRRGPARSQLGASRSERLQRGRIDVSVRRAVPSRVVLVDDVHTTGATLDACARALRGAGAAEVVALTWARALPVGSLSTPTGSALTPVNASRTISAKGSKRLNGGASYADRGQRPEHPRHG